MKFFKKPVSAILIALLIIFGVSSISISVKLSNKCADITEGFYYGIRQKGILYKSIYSCLDKLCALADEVVLVAGNYGIKTTELENSTEELRRHNSYGSEDIDDIYEAYAEFNSQLRAMEHQLSATGLSQRHIELMTNISAQIAQLRADIDMAGYNDSVRDFYKKYDRFPTNLFAEIFNIDYPEYFS